LGLIPGAGDAVSLFLQAYLVFTFLQKGVSGEVAARITFNILVDTVVGSVPILGQIWDFWFKANQRNLRLVEAHWHQGAYSGSGWPYWLLMILLFVGTLFLVGYIVGLIIQFLISLFSG